MLLYLFAGERRRVLSGLQSREDDHRRHASTAVALADQANDPALQSGDQDESGWDFLFSTVSTFTVYCIYRVTCTLYLSPVSYMS